MLIELVHMSVHTHSHASGMVAHACNSRTSEVEVETSEVHC